MGEIKLGVTLYSLTSEFVMGRLNLEGCLSLVHDLGFKGVEIVAAQMIPDYPFPTDEWLKRFKEMLEQYELEPTCFSAYIDNGIHCDHDLSEEEIIQYTENDLIYAKKAGFHLVRTQHSISPKIMESFIPMCQDMDMVLAVELHEPHTPDLPVWLEYIDLFARSGGYLAVVPDFSIFQEYPHQLHLNALRKAGFSEDKLQGILKIFSEGGSIEECQALALTDIEMESAKEIFSGYKPANYDYLRMLLPYAPYIHGKFYYVGEDIKDPCIPYYNLIPLLQEMEYDGYIAAEYEGHSFNINLDCIEQLKRYITMFNSLNSELRR